MIHNWFNVRGATEIGVALADQFAPETAAAPAVPGKNATPTGSGDVLRELLQQADHDIRKLRLNFYKRAKLANSFKWRLLENGVEKELVNEVTQRLVMYLSGNPVTLGLSHSSDAKSTDRRHSDNPQHLLQLGNKSIAQGNYADAIGFYQDLIAINPRHPTALNNLGAALAKQGSYKEALDFFYQALKIDPNFPDAYSNVGSALMLKGRYEEAEGFLRRALKLNPRLADARINLGLTLISLGRLQEAKSHLQKVLKSAPRNAGAMFAMVRVAKAEGNFDDANALLNRALEIDPNLPNALASFAGLRKMTSSDGAWLKRALEVAASGIDPVNESELRFAIGKYYDDTGEFKRAFESYKRANDLLKATDEPYDREGYKRFVDEMIHVYTPEVADCVDGGASASSKPVFVVGMPRSGTSLTEQIISSHPSAGGAGELMFWRRAVHEYAAALEKGPLSESTRSKLAHAYLRLLDANFGEALRVVDKAPVNADYLGVIHSIFPNARIIYMERNPVDTCLSCYFQKFPLSLNFTTDLSDLAHYYRHHERLMAHWRSVLPPGTILAVPYEGLVVNQEAWTRKILDFLGLGWHPRCMEFHETKRPVFTASDWQVRQKVYAHSVQRWRRYEKFIAPLLVLKDLAR
jgi:tetratricopeptide (TPR) repeat protein